MTQDTAASLEALPQRPRLTFRPTFEWYFAEDVVAAPEVDTRSVPDWRDSSSFAVHLAFWMVCHWRFLAPVPVRSCSASLFCSSGFFAAFLGSAKFFSLLPVHFFRPIFPVSTKYYLSSATISFGHRCFRNSFRVSGFILELIIDARQELCWYLSDLALRSCAAPVLYILLLRDGIMRRVSKVVLCGFCSGSFRWIMSGRHRKWSICDIEVFSHAGFLFS